MHGTLRRSYAEFYARSRQLGSALSQEGIGRGDTVSAVLANTPAMLECHYGVPMCGAVLHSINTRLDAPIIAFQLNHAASKLVIVDREFMPLLQEALSLCSVTPTVIQYDDPEFTGPATTVEAADYESFLADGASGFRVADAERTNGTRSRSTIRPAPRAIPRAWSTTTAAPIFWRRATRSRPRCAKHAVYLWTLPMFHCNGWCFPWTLSAVTGTHVCLRRCGPSRSGTRWPTHKVTHLCGAPIVMSALSQRPTMRNAHSINRCSSSPPQPRRLKGVLARHEEAGFDVTHLYGLTETYGPASSTTGRTTGPISAAEQAALKARQGVRYPAARRLDVLDPETMQPVPRDGETIGEVMFRGNMVMKGYLENRRPPRRPLPAAGSTPAISA